MNRLVQGGWSLLWMAGTLLAGGCSRDSAEVDRAPAGGARGGASAHTPARRAGNGGPTEPSAWSVLDLECRLQFPVDGVPEGVAVADLSGDGGADLLVAARSAGPDGAGTVRVWSGRLARHRDLPAAPWPLGPVCVPTEDGPVVVTAGRADDALWFVAPGVDGAAPEPVRLELGGRPRALGAGALEEGRPAVVVATREGELLWWDGEALHRSDLPDGSPTFVEVRPRTVVVGLQGPDRVLRAFPSFENELELGDPEPVDGIPRAWLTTPRGEYLAGGDRALWSHGADGWTAGDAAGLVPLRLAPLDGNRFASLSFLDLALRTWGADGPSAPTYAGQDPWDLATGDLDGDGLPDAAVVNRAARCVSVLLASDRGGWRDAPSHPTGRGPHSLASGDLDGDGRADLVALAAIDDRATVLRRGADGRLAPAGELPVGTAADRVRLWDRDGDGVLDLSVLVEGGPGAELEWHRGRGDGTFAAPARVPLGRGRGDACVTTDAAGRGHLWVADPSEACLWSLAPDATAATRVPLPATPTALAPLEAHGGATRGLLVGQDGARRGVALLVRGDDGALAEVAFVPLDVTPVDVEQADLDGDGTGELVVLTRTVRDNDPGTLVVLAQGTGGAWVERERHATGLRPMALATGDVDHDGVPDVVVAAQNSHTVNLWRAHGARLERSVDLGVGRGPLDVLVGGGEVVTACGFSDEVRVVRSR